MRAVNMKNFLKKDFREKITDKASSRTDTKRRRIESFDIWALTYVCGLQHQRVILRHPAICWEDDVLNRHNDFHIKIKEFADDNYRTLANTGEWF